MTRTMFLTAAVLSASLSAWGCGDDDGGSTDVDAGPAACTTDVDCDDGRFCNGPEVCDAERSDADESGCAPGDRPCMVTQSCDESGDACTTVCAIETDADGDGHDATECGGDDCDDADSERFPGNAEVCDGAGHDEDCDPATFGDKDADLDGHFDARCCNTDDMGATICGEDCDDVRRNVHPMASEVCDLFDNDCDGSLDEGTLVSACVDMDRDLHGDATGPMMMVCPDTVGFSIECDDCNDTEPTVHGGLVELCDALDNDCDGTVDENPRPVSWYRDADGDGFGSASSGVTVSCAPVAGHSLLPTDCDDAMAGINPSAPEQCNGIDDDCNGAADFTIAPGDTEDDDGDLQPDLACPVLGVDCRDDDALVIDGGPELCDAVDNDCDGTVDEDPAMLPWFLDLDGDGYGDEGEPVVVDCAPQRGRSLRGGDCDDSDATRRPGAFDDCDGRDDDCDSAFDENVFRRAFYADMDMDGFGVGTETLACVLPPGFVEAPGDCDDSDGMINPGGTESCNTIDDDCDSMVDEGVTMTLYPDGDGDGFGTMGTTMNGCTPLAGFADNMSDCDDASAMRFPGATEVCDSADDDCDGMVDEGGGASCMLADATATCMGGSCFVASCGMGFGNCDATAGNGCEVDTTSDASHCSGCGLACGLGASCVASSCETGLAQIDSGNNFSCVRRTNGRVVCWGDPGQGRLGRPGAAAASIGLVSGLNDAIDIDLGENHACAVRSVGGQVVCWGHNTNGELGTGSVSPSSATSPVAAAVSGAAEVAAGAEHTCARLTTGGVVCWGRGTLGELGNGASTSSLTPVSVRSLTDATMIAAGARHTCAIRMAGPTVCWGAGTRGQLGEGATTNRAAPVQVNNLPDAIHIAVSKRTDAYFSTCAVRMGGQLRCWGDNNFGRLGDGTTTQRTQPIVVSGLTNMREVTLGGVYTCARDMAGQVYCWGQSNRCATGVPPDGAVYMTPQTLSWLSNATQIATGFTHSCAIRADGTVGCWGDNTNGSNGLGYGDYAGCNARGGVLGLP